MGEGRGGHIGDCVVGLAFQQRRGPEAYQTLVSRFVSLASNHIPKGTTASVPNTAPSANKGGLAAPLGPAMGGASMTAGGGGLMIQVTLQALGHVMDRATSFPLAAARVSFGTG